MPGMWASLTVVWISLGLSACAAVALLLAARHSLPELRPTFAAGGVLAAIYCGSYIWLAFNYERAQEWSQLMRPVGMVSWLVVWVMPATISMRVWAKLRRAAHSNVHPINSGSVGDATERYRKGA
jgi:hypothetical protein